MLKNVTENLESTLGFDVQVLIADIGIDLSQIVLWNWEL